MIISPSINPPQQNSNSTTDNAPHPIMDTSSPMITLISSQGDKFDVSYDEVIASSVLKSILSRKAFQEFSTQTINFSTISTSILKRLIQYMSYKHQHSGDNLEIPEFKIDPKESVELLIAADFLDL